MPSPGLPRYPLLLLSHVTDMAQPSTHHTWKPKCYTVTMSSCISMTMPLAAQDKTEKKHIVEIAFTHIRLTQLTRNHTLNFCLRILTRLKVLLTQPFDMSKPFCKQSTAVLNAAQLRLVVYPIIYKVLYLRGGNRRISSINSSKLAYNPIWVSTSKS